MNPYLLFCPYLPLSSSITFEGWTLTPIDQFNGPWQSDDFERLSRQFLRCFQDANGRRIENPVLVSRNGDGADGTLPSGDERIALQAALHFSTIDGNADQRSDNAGWFTATTNNSELFIWPIDVQSGHIAIARGLLVRVLDGGYQIGNNLEIRAPLELHIPMGVRLDSEMLSASYNGFFGSGQPAEVTERLRNTNRWLAKAWRNSQDLGWDDRILMLKTAFEALTGESTAAAGAEALHWIYGEFKNRRHPTVESTSDLLWSPTERRSRVRRWTDRSGRQHSVHLSNLEHWYCSFADARNKIIHDGVIPPLEYRAKGSAYEGHYFHVGERLLRETIKILFDAAGYPDLWRSSMSRAITRALRDLDLSGD